MTNFRNDLVLLTGMDVSIPECQLVIHQPTLNEISMMGERDFFIAGTIICVSKNAFQELDNIDISNLQLMMKIFGENQEKKILVQNLLTIMCPQYRVNFTPRSILFRPIDENDAMVVIDDNNFTHFQKAVKEVLCMSQSEKDNFNPQGEQAKAIAQKLMRARQRVAAQKEKDGNNGSTLAQYISTISVGLHLSIQEVSKFTLYQIYDLMERLGMYINWDIEIRAKMAGSTSDTKPENWMRKIH